MQGCCRWGGVCPRGDKCRFLHDDTQAELERVRAIRIAFPWNRKGSGKSSKGAVAVLGSALKKTPPTASAACGASANCQPSLAVGTLSWRSAQARGKGISGEVFQPMQTVEGRQQRALQPQKPSYPEITGPRYFAS